MAKLAAGRFLSPIDGPDALQRAAVEIASSLASETEGVIRAAIDRRLGRDDWQLDELSGRLEVRCPHNKPGIEAFHLDGLPLVTFYPARSEGSQSHIGMYRQYEIHD